MPKPPKPFGRRAPPEIKPKPPVLHAPLGLGGPEPNDPRRLRSLAVVVTALGLGTLAALWLSQRNRCQDDWSDTTCRSSGGHSSGGHGGSGFHMFFGGSSSPTAAAGANAGAGAHGAAFGGFGGTGEGGAHSGGGHGGGGGE